MPPASRPTALSAAALLSVGAFGACSSEEAAPPPLPQGPPDLGIVSIAAPGASAGSGSCFPLDQPKNGSDSFAVVLKTDKAGRIPLLLPDGSQPRFWTFQAPFGCAGAPDCGFALLLVDPESEPCDPKPHAAFSTISAGPTISVPYDGLRKALDGRYGTTTLRIEFWPSEGKPDPKLCRLRSVETTIDFELRCGSEPVDGGTEGGGLSEGGHDASTDAHPDASTDGAAKDATPDVRVPEASTHDASTSDAADAGSDDGSSDAMDAQSDGPG